MVVTMESSSEVVLASKMVVMMVDSMDLESALGLVATTEDL
jgi:hypothetical protein